MRKYAIPVIIAILLFLCGQAAAEKVITISFTGDCTLGSEERTKGKPYSFDTFVREKGYSYFFENFYGLFSADDCTIANCEGVLSDSSEGELTNKRFRFRGTKDFAQIFSAGSVEAVSLANNHIKDYSTQGVRNTKRALEEAGVGWAYGEDLWLLEKDGIRIAFASIDYSVWVKSNKNIRKKILEMKEKGEINAAVLLIHQGKEYAAKHGPDQDAYADYYLDQGAADLVVMHHPHVLQGIRISHNRTILYSLGNFVFGGYDTVTRGDSGTNSLYTVVVQAKLYFTDEGKYMGQQIFLYPAYVSGEDPVNNYQPIRVTAEQAEPVIKAIQDDTEWELPPMWTDENGLAYLALQYLPAEEDIRSGNGEPEPAASHPDRSNR